MPVIYKDKPMNVVGELAFRIAQILWEGLERGSEGEDGFGIDSHLGEETIQVKKDTPTARTGNILFCVKYLHDDGQEWVYPRTNADSYIFITKGFAIKVAKDILLAPTKDGIPMPFNCIPPGGDKPKPAYNFLISLDELNGNYERREFTEECWEIWNKS